MTPRLRSSDRLLCYPRVQTGHVGGLSPLLDVWEPSWQGLRTESRGHRKAHGGGRVWGPGCRRRGDQLCRLSACTWPLHVAWLPVRVEASGRCHWESQSSRRRFYLRGPTLGAHIEAVCWVLFILRSQGRRESRGHDVDARLWAGRVAGEQP